MLVYLEHLETLWGPFRLFGYVTFRAGCAFFTATLITFFLGPLTVKYLKRFNTVAPQRLEGLVANNYIDEKKGKTPSMGGALIVISVTVSTLLWAILSNPLVIVFLCTLICLALLGFSDDYVKIKYSKRDGIPGKVKLAGQIIIAGAATAFLYNIPQTSGIIKNFMIPFIKTPLFVMPAVLAYIFSILVVTGASNAVNLTDGKDGLAVGCTIFCTLTYAAFSYICGHKIFASHLQVPFISGVSEVSVFAMAIAGACIGFLWYNCHPASMFMGDTGSLALGGTIGLIAVLVKQEITLIIVGGVFVIEVISVIIQVISFKLFKKRVFLCTPIHHHFEQKGWTETQIVVRFWILSGLFALMGLATLKLR